MKTMETMKTMAATQVVMRKPTEHDGAAMWQMVEETSTLDGNSPYAYLMLCKYFADTCVIAEAAGEPIGFIAGFRLPSDASTLFIWQIGVRAKHRGKRVAGRMIESLIKREACRDVRFLEATVTDTNAASRSLFQGMAAKLKTRCEVKACFPEHLFPKTDHEAEWTYRIGPMNAKR